MKTYKVEHKGLSLSEENLYVPDNATFYKINKCEDNFDDWVTVIPFSKKCLRRLNYAVSAQLYNFNDEYLIVYYKHIKFKEAVWPITETLFTLPQKYLICESYDKKEDKYDLKEIYKLIKFTGNGFIITKLRWKNPLSDQIEPAIISETVNLPILFKTQKHVDIGSEGALYTSFGSEFDYLTILDKVKSYLDI